MTLKILTGLNLSQNDQCAQAVTIIRGFLRGRCLSLFDNHLVIFQRKEMERRAQAAYANTAGNADQKQAAYNNIINQGVTDNANKVFDGIDQSIKGLLTNLMPKKVLARVKRHLRRNCRKPKDMEVQRYAHLLDNMSGYEFPRLPPFGLDQSLQPDELLDILLCGVPKSWEKELLRQGFDPLLQGLWNTVSKLEDVEAAETFDGSKSHDMDKKKSPSKKGQKSNKKNSQGGRQHLHCMIHGEGNPELTPADCERRREAGVLHSGMLPKVAAALRALTTGLTVKIAHAAGENAVLAALDPEAGTVFSPDEEARGG